MSVGFIKKRSTVLRNADIMAWQQLQLWLSTCCVACIHAFTYTEWVTVQWCSLLETVSATNVVKASLKVTHQIKAPMACL